MRISFIYTQWVEEDRRPVCASTSGELPKIMRHIREHYLDAEMGKEWFPIELCPVPVTEAFARDHPYFKAVIACRRLVAVIFMWLDYWDEKP